MVPAIAAITAVARWAARKGWPATLRREPAMTHASHSRYEVCEICGLEVAQEEGCEASNHFFDAFSVGVNAVGQV